VRKLIAWLTAIAAVVLVAAAPLPAAAIEGSTNTAFFDNAVPMDPALFNQYPGLLVGEGTNHIQWGLPQSGGEQTQLIFTTTSIEAELGDVFSLGTLDYLNRPIYISPYDTRLASVDLMVTFSLTSPAGVPDTDFTFPLEIITTPNDGTDEEDFLIFQDVFPTYEFSVGETNYILEVIGFGQPDGQGSYSMINQFVVNEGDSVSAQLLGRMTAIFPEPEPIPAPASLILVAAGAAGSLAWFRNKKR